MSECLQTNLPVVNLAASELLKLAAQPATGPRTGSHCVQFYDDDSFLIEALSDYVRAGVSNGEACIVIATQEHRHALAARLLTHGLDVVNGRLAAHYYSLDAAELLGQFMVDGEIDHGRFMATVGEVVRNVCAQGRTVRAFGEMVALLATGGNFQAAVHLEQAWNELQSKHDFTLLCGYSLTTFGSESAVRLTQVCDAHSQVVPSESYRKLATPEERLRAIVLLQQKALNLEVEIAERKKIELDLRSTRDELKKLLVSEQLARAEAVTANRMKDEFLATVSHELRTPLNAIIGWTNLLGRGRLDQSSTRRAIETIERNARAQAQLVEDILDVSRVITGKLQLNIGRVDVPAIINATIDSVQPAARSKEIEIEVTLDPSIGHIGADANRLQQIIWNLLSNAIKFTPNGGRVNVCLRRKGQFIQIYVSDNGKGIKPGFVPFIFDRFRQEDASTTRSYGGLGLGLSIVRHLVELHGGTVAAYSAGEGQGATFTITLPNTPPPAELKPARIRAALPLNTVRSNSRLAAPSVAGRRILLVDDDVDTLRMMAEVFNGQEARVELAGSVKQAMEAVERFQPDVIVSDLAMPDEDRYSLIEMIRARETSDAKAPRVIALTALVRIEDRARALSAGFNVFLAKPVQPSELISAVASLTEAA